MKGNIPAKPVEYRHMENNAQLSPETRINT